MQGSTSIAGSFSLSIFAVQHRTPYYQDQMNYKLVVMEMVPVVVPVVSWYSGV